MKLIGGLFAVSKNQSFFGAVWEIFSRLTWQGLQTAVGYLYNSFSIVAGQVDEIKYYEGATFIKGNNWGSTSAITLGSYVRGGTNMDLDITDDYFQHEFGHYLQSKVWGPAYLFGIGIPSIISAGKKDPNYSHNYFWTEQDANARSLRYFTQKGVLELDDGTWKYAKNPVVGYPSDMPYWTNQEYLNLYFRKKNKQYNDFLNILKLNF
jgi:hypothetical protein